MYRYVSRLAGFVDRLTGGRPYVAHRRRRRVVFGDVYLCAEGEKSNVPVPYVRTQQSEEPGEREGAGEAQVLS